MSTKPNYFTIGLFVLVGLILILGALIVLGAGSIWREHVYVETYVNESIQGIETGSAVKMRGVKIGNVQNISFVNIRYPEATEAQKRYVIMEISLSLNSFGDMNPAQLKSFLKSEVKKGLRIRLQPMGLTGSAFMEMDYTAPGRYPPLPLSWTPENPYIPSAPGTFARLEETFESMSNTMARIEKLDLEKTLDNLDNLIVSLSTTVESLDMKGLSDQARLFLEEMRESNRKLSMMMGPENKIIEENVNFYSIMNDAGAMVSEIRRGLDRLNINQDGGTMDELAQTVSSLRLASSDMPKTLKDIQGAANSVHQSTQGFSRFSRKAYSLLATQNEKIESIMRNLEITSRNLMEISTDAKNYPSYIFFGEKPLEGDQK
ncbi:MAG: MlaD family protein [Desulfonatronovibrio sp.]